MQNLYRFIVFSNIFPFENDVRTVLNTPQVRLRVCDMCGAQLSLMEHETRLADHYGGKMHCGMETIREQYSEMKVRSLIICKIYLTERGMTWCVEVEHREGLLNCCLQNFSRSLNASFYAIVDDEDKCEIQITVSRFSPKHLTVFS